MGQKPRYNLDYFKNIIESNGGTLLSNQYRVLSDILKIKCELGHEWETSANSIHNGHWCWDCFCLKCRIPFDEDFFSRDNEESFYVAGFMAADGWKTRSSGGYVNGIGLALKDEDHLLKIKNAIKYDGDLRYDTRYNTILPNGSIDEISEQCKLTFSSQKTFKDLERFNVVERKTYIYLMPEWLVEHHLVHHFMRGYIDGDGCFNLKYNKGQRLPQLSFNMRATAVFLQQFHDIIFKNKITPNDRKILPRDGKRGPTFNKLQYSGNVVMTKMYEFLYKDATISMNRKKDIAKLAPEYRVDGTDKKRVVESKKGITRELLLTKFVELKSTKLVSDFFDCTTANISYMTKSFGIRQQIKSIVNNYPTIEKIEKEKVNLGSYTKVAEKYNISRQTLANIIKKAS
jgi:hypothetical protein